jgi:hypothetical protein
MPLFREALGTATASLHTFTLSEILPVAQELYKEYLVRDGIYTKAGPAGRHATSVFSKRGRSTSFFGTVINNLGVHRSTTRIKKLPSGATETIYERVGE